LSSTSVIVAFETVVVAAVEVSISDFEEKPGYDGRLRSDPQVKLSLMAYML
jgi:hypothetical protein